MVEFAINTSLSEGRGTSPAELAHGEPLRSPLNAMVGNQPSGLEAGELSSRVQVLVQRAKEHLECTCAYQRPILTMPTGMTSLWMATQYCRQPRISISPTPASCSSVSLALSRWFRGLGAWHTS